MTTVTPGTKRRAAIEKRPRASTLITGGTGFLGSHLVRQLVEDGAKDIRVMATSIPDWLVDLGVEPLEGSITKSADAARAVEGIRDVYHLAGRVSRERDDARDMYALHVEGTRLLCEAAKAEGVKSIVMASTSGTIAVTKDGEVVPDETYPPPLDIISRWPYYASTRGIPVVSPWEFPPRVGAGRSTRTIPHQQFPADNRTSPCLESEDRRGRLRSPRTFNP